MFQLSILTKKKLEKLYKKVKIHQIFTYILEKFNFVHYLNKKREKRGPYKYKSGAVYEGEWIGGFRDGLG